MHKLDYRDEFYKDLAKIKDKSFRERIVNKTLELESRLLGKKLEGNPYWSLRIGAFRIIFGITRNEIDFYRILPRKFKYRELR